jgi:hypothetical protein
VVFNHEHTHAGTNANPGREPRLARPVAGPNAVKAKVFEVILHKLPSGKPPANDSCHRARPSDFEKGLSDGKWGEHPIAGARFHA